MIFRIYQDEICPKYVKLLPNITTTFHVTPGTHLTLLTSIDDHSSFHFSWTKVLYDFVMNDNVGPWARVTRPTKVGRVEVPTQQEYEQQMKTVVKQASKRG